jgi:hypothetical protein
MGLILRVDVDKPYGHHKLWRKILSKLVEDYFPRLPKFPGYLSQLREFLYYCNQNSVSGIFFHRLCTIPDQKTKFLLSKGNHEIGLHLENSRTQETVEREFNQFSNLLPDIDIRYFSKHGSGSYKLGKYHEPSYKPELYRKWSENLKISLHSGNDILESSTHYSKQPEFNSSIFWMEPSYRKDSFSSVDQVIELAIKIDIVVLIHPCNFITDPITKSEFHKLVEKAREFGVPWKKI